MRVPNAVPSEVILWGGTGQAKVVRPIIESLGGKVVAVFDDTPNLRSPFPDVPIYCGYAAFEQWLAARGGRDLGCCVAIGNPHGRARLALQERLAGEGLSPVTIAHASAVIEGNASIGEGAQILAGAVVAAEASVGRACIVNTRASVDHECVLADGVELAPDATLRGLVRVGAYAWIGAGATVPPPVRIGSDAIVGAGAVVIHNVPDGTAVVGVPARPLAGKRAQR